MAEVKKINHVAIVVPDIENALSFWGDALGLRVDHVEEVESQKVQVAFIPIGNSEVELVKPTGDETGIARYLVEHPAGGMHHLCLEVDDIDGMMQILKARGVRMINETPLELEGRKAAFIHPKSACGVLVELYQITD